jgi:hypothetical protein
MSLIETVVVALGSTPRILVFSDRMAKMRGA